jgi:GH24 family phage-related lysozyme (muramidase)
MLLTSDMHKAVDIVAECVPGLPEKVHAAFADAVFNMGPTIACSKKKSTAARMLAEGDYVGACNQLARWTKARIMGAMVELPGLVKRRARERELCLQGVV